MSTTATTIVPIGTWQLDPVHSTVGFEVPYLVGTFKGEFRDVQATLAVADGGATLEGAARVSSIDVKDENLAAHLQSPEFFDGERHPELRFRADGISLEGESVAFTGDITIKGVTKPVAVTGTLTPPLTDAFGKERIGLRLSATVDRTDFGITWNVTLPTGRPALADEVTIVAELYFVKAAQSE